MARAGTVHKGGRPKGSKTAKTLEREKVLEAYTQKIMNVADQMFRSKMTTALGSHKFIQIIRDKNGKVKDTITIRSTDEMDAIMKSGTYGEDFIFAVGEAADWRAIDSMENRAFGKPTESLELKNKDGQPFIIKMDS